MFKRINVKTKLNCIRSVVTTGCEQQSRTTGYIAAIVSEIYPGKLPEPQQIVNWKESEPTQVLAERKYRVYYIDRTVRFRTPGLCNAISVRIIPPLHGPIVQLSISWRGFSVPLTARVQSFCVQSFAR